VAKKVREADDRLAPWELAGDGWKIAVQENSQEVTLRLTGRWNTPKSEPIKELFRKALGIPDITASWHWQGSSLKTTKENIDKWVTLRGEIAHRAKAPRAVKKKYGTKFFAYVTRLADKIDADVSAMLKDATGITYW
jgi:hypothetical protein